MPRPFYSTLLLIGLFALSACDSNTAAVSPETPPPTGLAVSDARIRLPVPGKSTGAGYFTLHNHTQQTVAIQAIRSDVAGAIELHEHIHRDGQMQMRRMANPAAEAQSSLQLQPGGKHLMLFDMAWESGQQTATLQIDLDNGMTLEVSARLESLVTN